MFLYFIHFFVIDTRDAQSFAAGNIATSHNFPCQNLEARKFDNFLIFMNKVANTNIPENFSPVIIYSEGGDMNLNAFVNWLASILQDLKSQKLRLPITGSGESKGEVEEEYNPLNSLVDQLVNKCHEIWILDQGYENFKHNYPFLCGHITFSDMEPTPHIIMPNLFLGTRGFKLYPKMIHNLGITHLVVAKQLDFTSVKHLQVLQCDVEDKETQDMDLCFKACVQFISENIKYGAKILVQLHGRSRSASIIIAYLIAKRNMSIKDAFELVHAKCKAVDVNQIWASQLEIFQSTLQPVHQIK